MAHRAYSRGADGSSPPVGSRTRFYDSEVWRLRGYAVSAGGRARRAASASMGGGMGFGLVP